MQQVKKQTFKQYDQFISESILTHGDNSKDFI